MKSAAAATVSIAQKQKDAPEALLRFSLKAYQPRAASQAQARLRESAVPQSIKDAIVRWLDEQL